MPSQTFEFSMVGFADRIGHSVRLFCAYKIIVNVRDIDSRVKVRCALERYVETKVVTQLMQLAGFFCELFAYTWRLVGSL